jgi:hypothetical protein
MGCDERQSQKAIEERVFTDKSSWLLLAAGWICWIGLDPDM